MSSSQWNHHQLNHTPNTANNSTNIGGNWGEEEEATSSSTHQWTGVQNSHTNGSSSHSSHSNASNGSWTGNHATHAPKNIEANESSWRESNDVDHHSRGWNNPSNPSWAGETHRRINEPISHSSSGWSSEPMQPNKPIVVQQQQQPFKKESVSSSGWDAETMNGDANGSASDDGTAVWGNPVRQQLKVRKWTDNDNDQPSSSQSNPMNAKSGVNMSMLNSANNGSNIMNPGNNTTVTQQQSSSSVVANNGSGQHHHHHPHGLLPSSPGMIRLPNNNMSNNPSKANEWSSKQSNPRSSSSWVDHSSRESNSWGDNNQDPRTRNNWGDSHSHGDHLSPSSPQGYWGQRNNSVNSNTTNSWSDGQVVDTSSWSGKQKPLTKEMIWASKQFRILTEQGFKKEEAEHALRSCNMNLEEAMNELRNWTMNDKRSPVVGNTPSPSSLLMASRSVSGIIPNHFNPSLANRNPNSNQNDVLPSVSVSLCLLFCRSF
jgi:trinucleotide repeat-containing gene 6 protein